MLILILYAHSITNSWLPFIDYGLNALSKKSDGWADFGSLLSGLFGASSLFATMLTLGYVIYQSEKSILRSEKKEAELKVAQNEQDLKIEKYNEKLNEFHLQVLEFNKLQERRNTFDKFKLHKEAFDDLILNITSDLQSTYKGLDVSIKFRSELYKSIFPKNSFNHFDSNTTQNMANPVSIFNLFTHHLTAIEKWKNADWEHDSITNITQPFLMLHKLLKLTFVSRDYKSGAFYDAVSGRYIFSLHDFNEECDALIMIINRLREFSHVEEMLPQNISTNVVILRSRMLILYSSIMNKSLPSSDSCTVTHHLHNESEVLLFSLYFQLNRLKKRHQIYVNPMIQGGLNVTLGQAIQSPNALTIEEAYCLTEAISDEAKKINAELIGAGHGDTQACNILSSIITGSHSFLIKYAP